jgi:hypothetical protein
MDNMVVVAIEQHYHIEMMNHNRLFVIGLICKELFNQPRENSINDKESKNLTHLLSI